MPNKDRSNRFILFLCTLFMIFYIVKIFAPGAGIIANNQVHWSTSETFDQSATITTASNYAKNGFFKNYGLPNRAGTSSTSRFGVPCHGKLLKEVKINDLEGNPVTLQSLTGECVYTRSPPLTFWLYGVALKLTNTVKSIHLLSCFFQVLFLYVLFLFLSRIANINAAAIGVTVFSMSNLYWGWGLFLYSFSFNSLFIALTFAAFQSTWKRKRLILILSSFAAAFSLLDTVPLLTLYPIVYALLRRNKDKLIDAALISATSGISILITMILSVAYLGGIENFLIDIKSIGDRYTTYATSFEWVSFIFSKNYIVLKETFYPFEVLALLTVIPWFIPRLKRWTGKRDIHLLALIIASVSFILISRNHAFYHTHITFHHFQFLLAVILTYAANFIILIKDKTLGHAALTGLLLCASIYALPNINTELKLTLEHFYNDTNEYDLRKKIIDLNVDQEQDSSLSQSLIYNTWKDREGRHSFIDGSFPPFDSGYQIRKRLKTSVSLFFLLPEKVKSFELLTHSVSLPNIASDCEISFWNKDFELVQVNPKWKESDSYKVTPYRWIQKKINGLTRGFQLNCTGSSDYSIYELRIL